MDRDDHDAIRRGPFTAEIDGDRVEIGCHAEGIIAALQTIVFNLYEPSGSRNVGNTKIQLRFRDMRQANLFLQKLTGVFSAFSSEKRSLTTEDVFPFVEVTFPGISPPAPDAYPGHLDPAVVKCNELLARIRGKGAPWILVVRRTRLDGLFQRFEYRLDKGELEETPIIRKGPISEKWPDAKFSIRIGEMLVLSPVQFSELVDFTTYPVSRAYRIAQLFRRSRDWKFPRINHGTIELVEVEPQIYRVVASDWHVRQIREGKPT